MNQNQKNSRWRSKRIGLDIDGENQLQLLKSWFNAHAFFPKAKIEIKRTGHGYHIRIFQEHSIEQNFHVRRNLGDDPTRIFLDEFRVRVVPEWIDTLFNSKRQKGKITKEEDCNILAMPFISRLPCRKERIK